MSSERADFAGDYTLESSINYLRLSIYIDAAVQRDNLLSNAQFRCPAGLSFHKSNTTSTAAHLGFRPAIGKYSLTSPHYLWFN